jgi:hypothetical protein
VLYSYPSWFSGVGVTDAQLASYPLFIASPNACATVPAPWSLATFWQYGQGPVAGITGNVDVDRFFGTYDQLLGLTNPPAGGDAGTGGDAGSTDSSQPGGCGCQGGRSTVPWSIGAFVVLLALRVRTSSRRSRARSG